MKRFVLLLLFAPLLASADERILSFHSDIVVEADGWIEVTETIRVRAEGQQIRRGIFRDFPTTYVDKRNLVQTVDYRPQRVLRNETREDFHSEYRSNGVRTYFGHKDRFLSNGEHTYEFTYRAHRVLGFFAEHDELYWNVTGFDWAFPIDGASATVRFAFDVDAADIEVIGYTGPMFAKGNDYVARVDDDAAVHVESTLPLSPVNGLTFAISWPKGLVAAPTDSEKLGWVLRDNRYLIVAAFGFVLLLVYNVPVWFHFGRDPEEGVIVTRYKPPRNYSPASLRYIRQMYYDNETMTAAVLNLAVKGHLDIVNDGDEHELRKKNRDPDAKPKPLAAGERELFDALFKDRDSIVLKNENHRVLGKARRAHRDSLNADYAKTYFKTNGLLNLPSAVITIASTVIAFSMLNGNAPGLLLLVVAVNFAVMIFFGWIMKRPTLRGRKVLDEMLGFRDYLDVAEKDELNLRNPPRKTPELFEAYLPYALALGVEQGWSEKFAGVLGSVHDDSGRGYTPTWYVGDFNTSRLSASTKSLSSGLGSAISSSVTPPGSSSGGGGGGSSGGGGGGGGGGGW